MTRAAKSIFCFGVYLVPVGGTLLCAPNVLLGIVRIPPTSEVWLRLVGVLALILAAYCLTAARHELVPIFRVSVPGRIGVAVAFAAFAVLGLVEPQLMLFGGADLAAALWTWWALRADAV